MKKLAATLALSVLVLASLSAQTVTVIKPALNETWIKGQAYTIIWTKSGTMPNLVRISLRNAATLAEITLIQDNAPNSGSCQWTIPAATADGSYKIRVKVKNVAIEDDSDAFTISANAPVHAAQQMAVIERPPVFLKFPALSISNAGLVSYDDRFVVTFAYKNSGTGPLPKSSEMPVKPNFRVILDGKEVNQGSLTFPAFPAPPGWEVPSFYGCEIKLQAPGEFDETWTIGNTLDIRINENKINGMASDAKTYNLRQLALNYSFDAYINGATYDWNTETLTASIRVDGEFGPDKRFRFFNTGSFQQFVDEALGGFLEVYDLVPGQHYYQLSHKVHPPGEYAYKLDVWLGVIVLKPGSEVPDPRDVHHPNNRIHFTFHR